MSDPLTTAHENLAAATTSAPTPADQVLNDQQLRELLATVVLAADGVTRLEPTLANVLRRIAATRHGASLSSSQPSADGIVVTTNGMVTDISIDITTHQQALRTATNIQQLTRALLTAHGRAPGQIIVNVLSIDHPATD